MLLHPEIILCHHCSQDPGCKKEIHWKGFYDMDTRQYCCHACSAIHYTKKAGTQFKGLYSEFPVIVQPAAGEYRTTAGSLQQ